MTLSMNQQCDDIVENLMQWGRTSKIITELVTHLLLQMVCSIVSMNSSSGIGVTVSHFMKSMKNFYIYFSHHYPWDLPNLTKPSLAPSSVFIMDVLFLSFLLYSIWDKADTHMALTKEKLCWNKIFQILEFMFKFKSFHDKKRFFQLCFLSYARLQLLMYDFIFNSCLSHYWNSIRQERQCNKSW